MSTNPHNHWTGLVCIGVCAVVGASWVRHLLIHYRNTLIQPITTTTQTITQETEDTLSTSTLKKLINSTTYSIRETAARIVCDRALHDTNTIESLLWYITRPDHDTREKALRALFMLATKANMHQLNKPRVYSAIVKSLTFCITDVEHEPYDKEFDNWDFRDVNERLCLMIVHRFTTEFGIRQFLSNGFVPRWLAKEPWGKTEEEIKENIQHCNSQNRLLSFILLTIMSDPVGRQDMVKAKLISPSRTTAASLRADLAFHLPNLNSQGEAGDETFLASFEILPSIEGGAPRVQERSAEEQRMRRNHRDAMVLHDGSEPLGLDSIIQREMDSSSLLREELMEEDRQRRTQGILATLTQSRLENMREILRHESTMRGIVDDQVGVEYLRGILEDEINSRIVAASASASGNDADDNDTPPELVDE